MTVGELVKLPNQHDPNAVVVLRHHWDDHGVITCEELHQGDVQAAQLRRLQSKDSWFDQLAGSQLYKLWDGDNEDIADAVNGILFR